MNYTTKNIFSTHQDWLNTIRSNDYTESINATELALIGCRRAVIELCDFYRMISYPVTNFLLPTASNLNELIHEFENKTNQPLPPVLTLFYQIVGGISMVDLEHYSHVDFWAQHNCYVPNEYCDGIEIYSFDREWSNYLIELYEERSEWDAEDLAEIPYVYYFSPDGFHKDNISGGEPYGIEFTTEWEAKLTYFFWAKTPESIIQNEIDFMGYLRTAILECAGFPGLLGNPNFESIRKEAISELELF